MITSHEELDAYKLAFRATMAIFRISKSFPREEVYSLTDQIRRSSRFSLLKHRRGMAQAAL